MSLFQEVAAHGLAYCEYNQALISIQNLNDAQKMRLVRQILEDVYVNVLKDNERGL
jgi:hypothetical protein